MERNFLSSAGYAIKPKTSCRIPPCSLGRTAKPLSPPSHNSNSKATTPRNQPKANMMIIPSINLNLFNSKVDLAPVVQEQTPALGVISKSRVRLGIDANLFSHSGDASQIITALEGSPFLQAKSNGNDIVVLCDAGGTPVAVIELRGKTFNIFSAHEHVPLAQVTQSGKILNVVMNGQSDPMFTIHKVVSHHPSQRFPTKHIIRKQGTSVASTRFGQGNSYMLTVNAGSDPCLITCLAIIADKGLP
jgi:hypothetical protein